MAQRVAVLRLGEAGSRYAGDLVAAGFDVSGDDRLARPPVGWLAATPVDAVTDAQVVLSLDSSTVAVDAEPDSAPRPGRHTVYVDPADAALVTRLVEGLPASQGTRRHAARRVHEMTAAVEYFDELGVAAHLSRAARDRLAEVAAARRDA